MLEGWEGTPGELPEQTPEQAHGAAEARQVRERHLITRAAQGDEVAWTRLFERYAPAVYRHVYYVSGNEETARAVLWTTYVQAQLLIGEFDRMVPLQAWLFRVAHSFQWDANSNEAAAVRDFGLQVEHLQSHPSEGLWQEMRQLPLEDRAVIVMWLIDGLTRGEIAYVLDKSLGSVEGVQRRSMLSLRKLVNGAYAE